jgi:hypothetical protein
VGVCEAQFEKKPKFEPFQVVIILNFAAVEYENGIPQF